MKLFISHASEDKDDFVHPLAEALRGHFEVWYDKWTLTVGDSLQEKIDHGLTTCDYGVVVLSPSFFAKKWTMAELDGLLALETKNRKMILPIWKDVDREEVTKFSPTLAGRVGVRASVGIPRVVEEIKQAVGFSERAREISQLDSVATKLRKLDASIDARTKAENLLFSTQGAVKIQEEIKNLISFLERLLKELSVGSAALKFEFPAGMMQGVWHTQSNLRIGMILKLQDHYVNSAQDARLKCTFYLLGKLIEFGEREKTETLEEPEFRPYFGTASEVVWKTKESTEDYFSTEQLGTFLLDKLYHHLERQMTTSRR